MAEHDAMDPGLIESIAQHVVESEAAKVWAELHAALLE